jgi:hypothetical protein
MRAAIPEDVYEENVGIWALAMEPEKIEQIGQELKKLREKSPNNP